MKSELSRNDVALVREDIIRMQQWVHSNAPHSTDPTIQALVENLSRTRQTLERLM